MAKIIINRCFGGYGWSEQALREISARKGERRDEYWDGDLREDQVAIAVLEEYGSEWCSSKFAKLDIATYNEEDYIADIDEYDGAESLKLIPRITESRIRNCRNVDEIVDLLGRLNVLVSA